jgi:glutamate/tyrosine decarboxylase-like PLP-dependent enzyme
MDSSIWQAFADRAERHQATLRDRPVVPILDTGALRRELAQRYDFAGPIPAEQLLREVDQLLAGGLVQVTHPRYFGLFNPSVRPVGVLADALAALHNPQLATWSHAPAAWELEQRVLTVFTGLIGWSEGQSLATFTTGGAESNVSALQCALARRFPGWDEQGLTALALRPTVYLSADAHHSFVKAARMAGLGTSAVREVPVDAARRLDLAALEARLAEDRAAGLHPLMVVATLGATGTGVLDPVGPLRQVADRWELWLHADAAWGGAALLSPDLRRHLAGIEGADSVTWDAHKWLSVPMGAGMYFCRHPEATRRAFAISAAYMPSRLGQAADDPYATTVQWSRRHIGLKVFMALAELGLDGYARLIEAQARMGDYLRGRLREQGWTMANRTPLPVVCFHREGVDPQRLLARIYAEGKVWISSLALPGGPTVLRACITSYHTGEADVDALVEALERAKDGP